MPLIYLVRHGQTDWNAAGVFRGHADRPLSPRGRREADLVMDSLGSTRLERILSSPLARAVQTATPLAGRLGLPVERVDELVDVNFGEWQGLTLDQVEELFPDLLETWKQEPGQVTFPGGESLEEVRMRCASLLRQAGKGRPGERVALFSHRVPLKVLVCEALGLGLEGFWRIRLDPASVSLIEVSAGERPVLVRLNDVSHLAASGTLCLTHDF